ncbi:MAG: pantoate--beta-alanine ligase [Actinomycetia bacterium]|nr:pantoate--beta-alanine ligase [Actinomycetes bacterium]
MGGAGLQVIDRPAALVEWSDAQRTAGKQVALVPTMGALHAGHLALITEARKHADVVIVSIFVNPLQFNRRDDFEAYPRPIDDDIEICRGSAVDAVYAPLASTMYPVGFQTHVEPGALADVLDGPSRPGHFRGVTTVVAKLFGAARPHVAVFGQKDFQQLAIIRRMVSDLNMSIEIVGVPTVREPDGLALSSRNRRLSVEQRAAAICVPNALAAIAEAAGTEPEVAKLQAIGQAIIEAEPLARWEQLEIVDPDTLQSLSTIEGRALAVTAVWFGEVRLIDNRLLG